MTAFPIGFVNARDAREGRVPDISHRRSGIDGIKISDLCGSIIGIEVICGGLIQRIGARYKSRQKLSQT